MIYSSEASYLAVWVDTGGWLRESPFLTKKEAEDFLKGKLKPVCVRLI